MKTTLGQAIVKCPECGRPIQVEMMIVMRKYDIKQFRIRAIKTEVRPIVEPKGEVS